MRIVFALIFFISGNHEPRIPVKIGDYEKYRQCEEQGRKLIKWEVQNAWTGYSDDKFRCIPVNAP